MRDPIETSYSRTYDRMSAIMWWVGWLLVCISISVAIAVVAYDWLLTWGGQ